jgi:hypothetical protein
MKAALIILAIVYPVLGLFAWSLCVVAGKADEAKGAK